MFANISSSYLLNIEQDILNLFTVSEPTAVLIVFTLNVNMTDECADACLRVQTDKFVH